ncbi:MAG TPA: TIR domain-containing protein, partial [Anaerolineales bacterium]|nr:TIR domain-containing protein [Anaerolineales bacterium]
MLPIRPLKVFLCHASADKYAARCLYYSLVDFEIDAWLDVENLLSGQDWEEEIPKAIKDSDAIIICLSKDSISKRGYVQKEIRFALDEADKMPSGRIFLVPVRLDDYEILPNLPPKLQGIQYVNLFEEDGCVKLLRSLQIITKQVGANPITNSTGGSMRDKARQLAKMTAREIKWKEVREQNPQMQKLRMEITTPLTQKLYKLGGGKPSVSVIGIFFTTLFALLALTISWIALSNSLQSILITETAMPLSTIDTPTLAPVVTSSVTEDIFVSDTSAYITTLREETSTQVFSTPIPPTQAPPTRIPPTATFTQSLTPTATATQLQCIQPPAGLISWWPGDGNARDIVGSNNGTLVGSVVFPAGKVGQAFSFDGIDDIVLAPTTGFPTGAASRTVAFWSKINPLDDVTTGFAYGTEAIGKGFYVFPSHYTTGGKLAFSGHGGEYDVLTPIDLRDSLYHHVAVTYDGAVVTIYSDGIFVASGSLTLDTGISGGASIGGRAYMGEFLTGEVDEVTVWNRALSTAEIQAMFGAGSTGMCK